MAYRVDNIPWPLRFPYLAASGLVAGTIYLYCGFCRLTSKIQFLGPGSPDLSKHSIFCLWHESWWPYFVVFWRYPSPHAMINHPAAQMKPIHLLLKYMGLAHLVLGSSGEEGRRAADRLAELVRSGFSTTISPDGPAGPPRVLKKGVLHIAVQSGVPVTPLCVRSSRFIPYPSWDSKKIPLPFCTFRVWVGEPIGVTQDSLDEAALKISEALKKLG